MLVDAMGGWKHGDNAEDQVVINGKNWTPEVMQLATFLHYSLPADNKKDHGLGGQYYARHAEKQLIAYFVNTQRSPESRTLAAQNSQTSGYDIKKRLKS